MNDLKGIIEDCNKSDLISDKVIKKIIEIIGQEKWQDLYDKESDICTTMGELIITLKNIPYLEKENSELKEKNNQLTRKSNCLTECNDGLQELLSDEIKTQEQLVKSTELLKRCYENFICLGPLRNEIKDFLKRVNIILEDAQAGNGPFDADKVFNKEMKAYSEEKEIKENEKEEKV